jgi:hypothetical protein
MKRISLLTGFLLVLSVLALAADKFVSADYGFACSFPGAPAQEKDGSTTRFTAYDGNHTLFTQVQIGEEDMSKVEDINAHLDEFVAGVAKSSNSIISSNKHVTLQGLPAAKVAMQMTLDDGRVFDVAMLVVMVKAKNRIYTVDAGTLKTYDHSGMQPFLDSFEIR